MTDRIDDAQGRIAFIRDIHNVFNFIYDCIKPSADTSKGIFYTDKQQQALSLIRVVDEALDRAINDSHKAIDDVYEVYFKHKDLFEDSPPCEDTDT